MGYVGLAQCFVMPGISSTGLGVVAVAFGGVSATGGNRQGGGLGAISRRCCLESFFDEASTSVGILGLFWRW